MSAQSYPTPALPLLLSDTVLVLLGTQQCQLLLVLLVVLMLVPLLAQLSVLLVPSTVGRTVGPTVGR